MTMKTSNAVQEAELGNTIESAGIDWRTRKRTVPMRVLALGMPRTATASLWTALIHLGYKDTHHMLNIFSHPDDAPGWREAAHRKRHPELPPLRLDEWDALLGNCQAVCDLPSIAFAPELIAAYPDALVILNIRPFAPWYASCMSTIVRVQTSTIIRALAWTDPAVFGKLKPMLNEIWALVWDDDFATNAERVHEEHHARVRELVPKERLLEFRPEMGWDPLCAFLGIDVPVGVNYPRVNDKDAFGLRLGGMINAAIWRSARNAVMVLTPVVVGVWAVWRARGGGSV